MGVSAEQRDAMLMVGRLFAQHGFAERAIRIMAALDVIHPADPDTLRGLAWAHFKAGQPQQALSALDRLAQQAQVDGGFHLLRTQVLAQLERHEEAATSMRAYLDSLATEVPKVTAKA